MVCWKGKISNLLLLYFLSLLYLSITCRKTRMSRGSRVLVHYTFNWFLKFPLTGGLVIKKVTEQPSRGNHFKGLRRGPWWNLEIIASAGCSWWSSPLWPMSVRSWERFAIFHFRMHPRMNTLLLFDECVQNLQREEHSERSILSRRRILLWTSKGKPRRNNCLVAVCSKWNLTPNPTYCWLGSLAMWTSNKPGTNSGTGCTSDGASKM